MVAATSFRLQVPLVRVKVGEDVGLGVEIQILHAHPRSREVGGRRTIRRRLGEKAEVVGVGGGRGSREAGSRRRRTRLREAVSIVVGRPWWMRRGDERGRWRRGGQR